MKFYKDQIFHIYNQGNNRRQIFFSAENYEFFLWKMKAYLIPFGDIIAWCLMPNHFHWLFNVNHKSIERQILRDNIDKIELARRIQKYGQKAQPVKRTFTRTAEGDKAISLNEAIGDLQKGYTRAINREKGWTGSLFRGTCKAKDGWIDEFITLNLRRNTDTRFALGNDYSFHCFDYIHKNPVDAGLVNKAIDYPWSSAKDYAGLRKGTLCNLELGRRISNLL